MRTKSLLRSWEENQSAGIKFLPWEVRLTFDEKKNFVA